ncbi:MAG: hypothetical protein RLZZ361_774 [Cyanobacteriota bacterium]|jgi:cell division protein FtsB
MEVENVLIIITSIAIGLLFGYFLAKQGAGSQRKPASLASISDKKLENEVLKDQVKQLESKIKTLEKALDMTK